MEKLPSAHNVITSYSIHYTKLYDTLSPCKECSKLIHQAGIVRVVYGKAYRDDSGLQFLEKAGIDLKLIEDLSA